MESPHVDYVTGLHVMPTHETGEIEIRYGDLNASSDEIHIKVHGKSCHGAYPDTGVDAIVMAAAVINSLQTLVAAASPPWTAQSSPWGPYMAGPRATSWQPRQI